MEKTKVEELFEWLDHTTETIQQHQEEPYLDSLSFTMEIMFLGEVPEDTDDILTHKLQQALQGLDLDHFQTGEIRKAVQLAILKGMKDSTQQQHLITPETVAMLVGYFTEKLAKSKEQLTLFDPAAGTANLLTTVLSRLEQEAEAYAGEVDPTLINLAALNANLQKQKVEFFHQDSLRPFLLDPVDMVVSDLPVGYYPDDIRASEYELRADEGHSYAHHLFIEQSLNYVKPGGYLIFVVPDFLFDSDQSDKLHSFLQENAHIVGVVRLPESAFKSEKQIKSILLLQKKGNGAEAPKQPLLAQVPSFKNANAMADILGKMNQWFAQYTGSSQNH
ncbi:class I SAM-dependent methyltransferase [Virgibacillus xinjiangensis]|uniref:Class I SAM-dependent methyltransferase n=1 Tax=Virgibacillus xinjiangensis TaxID=393090 RepID=A0ABV7CUU4_9BACI